MYLYEKTWPFFICFVTVLFVFLPLNSVGQDAAESRTGLLRLLNNEGRDTLAYGTGDSVHLSLIDTSRNTHPSLIDSVKLRISVAFGYDRENVYLYESDSSSSHFTASIGLSEQTPEHNDGTLQVRIADPLVALYNDSLDSTSTITTLIDGAHYRVRPVVDSIADPVTWKPAHEPYLIGKNLTIASSGQLTIKAGTRILIPQSGHEWLGSSGITVKGRLLIQGTADSLVQLEITRSDPQALYCGGITVTGQSPGLEINHARLNCNGIYLREIESIHGDTVNVHHTYLPQNGISAFAIRDSSVVYSFSHNLMKSINLRHSDRLQIRASIQNNKYQFNYLEGFRRLELINNELMHDSEKFYINKVDTLNFFYNQVVGGLGLEFRSISTASIKGNIIRDTWDGMEIIDSRDVIENNHFIGNIFNDLKIKTHSWNSHFYDTLRYNKFEHDSTDLGPGGVNIGGAARPYLRYNYFGTGFTAGGGSQDTIDARYNRWPTEVIEEMEQNSYPSNISVITDHFDDTLKSFVAYAGWLTEDEIISLSVAELRAEPGDTVLVPIYVHTPADSLYNSVNFSVEFPGMSLQLLGLSMHNSVLENKGWSHSLRVNKDHAHVSLFGSETLLENGTLINLQFIISGDRKTFYPINGLSAEFGGFSTAVEFIGGGIQVLIYRPTLAGDVNMDGKVTRDDARRLLDFLVGKVTLERQAQVNGWTSPDTLLTALDASLIDAYVRGELTDLPYETNDSNIDSLGVAVEYSLTDFTINEKGTFEVPFKIVQASNLMSFEQTFTYHRVILDLDTLLLGYKLNDYLVSYHETRGEYSQNHLQIAAAGPPIQILQTTAITPVFKTSKFFSNSAEFILSRQRWNNQPIEKNIDSAAVTLATGIESKNHPQRFALHHNYPNPFNPTTKIQFSLSRAVNVELNVYNTIGQKVSNLINKKMPAGSHSVNFSASGLTSGVYIYRIRAGDFTMSRKMLLLK